MSGPGPHRRRAALHERRGWPLAAVRPDYTLHRVNGPGLRVLGHRTHGCPGPIYATAYVAELRPTTRQVLTHALDPHATLRPRRWLTGGQSVEEFESDGAAERLHSHQGAVAAACTLLGHEVCETGDGAELAGVRSDTVGVAVGDVVVAVEGSRVRTARELAAALQRLAGAAAGTATVTLHRPGTPESPGVVEALLHRHDDGRWGLRAVTRARRLALPLDVELQLPGGLAGPSLGLATALSVLDVLTPGSVTGGASVAATGSVGVDGAIGPVGGVAFKARAVAAHPQVSRFVLPAADADAVAAARRVLGRRVEVLAVDTVARAIDALRGDAT